MQVGRPPQYFDRAKELREKQMAEGVVNPNFTAILQQCLDEELIAADDAQRLVKYLTPDSVVFTHEGKRLDVEDIQANPEIVLQGAPPSVIVKASGSSGSHLAVQGSGSSGGQLNVTAQSSSGSRSSTPTRQRPPQYMYRTMHFSPEDAEQFDLCCKMASAYFPGATICVSPPKPKKKKKDKKKEKKKDKKKEDECVLQ